MAAAIVMAPVQAFAATRVAASAAGVSLMVEARCLVMAAPSVFGAYKGHARMSISTIWITCTKSTPYSVGLRAVTGEGAAVTGGKPAGANGSVTYSLLSEPARTTNWDRTVQAEAMFGIGDGGAQSMNIYGQVMTDESFEPDTDFDTITVTVTF